MCIICGCGEGNLYIEGDEYNFYFVFCSVLFVLVACLKMKIIGIKVFEFIFSQIEEGDLYYGYGEVGIYVLGMSQCWMLEVEIDVLDKNNCLVECNCVCFVVCK